MTQFNATTSLSQYARRRLMSGATALLTIALATPAMAQTTAAPDQAAPAPAPALAPDATPTPTAGPDIVVTGSRIVASGFRAPTPTTMIGAADIAKNAEPNVFTTIAQLPSLAGSTGVTTGTNSTSSGTQGLSSFSLRGLGAIRTLTLLDGQRVVGANVTGVPDISLFPQLLIQRVDVVTGGASASYGSDAVGGVVNFVTDKHFEGFKANIQGGITDYGDDGQYTIQAAAGHAFLNNRLHVEVSGEYDHENGVPAGGFGEEAPNGRDWYNTATLINRGITNDGSPQYLSRDHAQAYQYTKYGLITAGPLQGIAFDANGNPFQFQYGSNGIPAKDAKGTVKGCYIGFCVGGDLSGNVGIGSSLQSALKRWDGYSRIGFDLNSRNEIYTTINIAQVDTSNQPNPGAAKSGLTLQCDNPFVPESIQDQCAADGITSFQYGVSNAILPNIVVHTSRKQYRFVGGADGTFPALGSDWHYDAYYEHGENISDIHVDNVTLNQRYNNAIQAITLDGAIVCADPVARASGCQPINIIGGAAPSQSALNYIEPANGPFQHTRQTEDVVSANLSGSPLSSWAGPISLATGVEYRNEFYRVNGDPYGNGVTDDSQYTNAYPEDPTLSDAGNNWYAGNYHDGHGSYHVFEGYLEMNVPLLDSSAGKANLDMAGRVTNYSTSGTVYTWKIGGTWDTPIDGIRLRAVTSRDIRAPNLSELYAAPISINIPNFTNPFNNTSVNISQNTVGNPNLTPEVARNTEAGIVLSHPHWLPGFSVSFDYYRINLKNAIAALSAQDQVNYCAEGVTQLCGTFYLDDPTNTHNYVTVQPFNLASIFTDGFDIEASYQFTHPFQSSGNLTLRVLATNVRNYITNTGLPGAIPVQQAGVNSGATPHWKLLGVENWSNDRFSFTLQQRWISDGVYGNQYIVCSAGNCPISTVNNPTIDDNHMPGAFYLDVSGSYNVTPKVTAFFKVDNLFNRDPTASPQTNTGIDINPQLYDTLGRLYRFGIRYNF
jgi:outer membrane receptor protein involved in Fe transport